jgi:hypothetical protein
MQSSGNESAVTQFDRYVMARKKSEKDLLSDLRESGDEEDGRPRQPKVGIIWSIYTYIYTVWHSDITYQNLLLGLDNPLFIF